MFTVPIGVDDAWTAFNDIEGIAPCLPGATITSVEGDEFTGAAKVKLGPISLQYTGKGRWTSRDAAEYRAVIEASGKEKRGNGTAAATITAHLEPEGSGTRVVVDTDLRITGRPAQFGRGVIQDVGNKLLDQFASCLSERLGQPAEEGVPTPAEVFGDAAPEPSLSGSEVDGAADRDEVVVAAGGNGAGATSEERPPRVSEDPTPPDVRADELAQQGSAGTPAATPASSAASSPASTRAASSAEAALSDAAVSDPAPPDVPVGDAAGEAGGPSVVFEAADVPDVPTSPPGSAPAAATTPAPAATGAPPSRRPAEAAELDLGGLLGPVLLRRYGPTAAAVIVTAVLTWVVARRRYA